MHGINRMNGKTSIGGFTLIEIMIIVAVIGILAAIALPAYQDYTVRSKVSEGIGFASAAKVAVVSAYSHGGLPGSNAEAGLSEAGDFESQYVESVKIEEGGNIRVTFNETIPQLTGKSVMLAERHAAARSIGVVTARISKRGICRRLVGRVRGVEVRI